MEVCRRDGFYDPSSSNGDGGSACRQRCDRDFSSARDRERCYDRCPRDRESGREHEPEGTSTSCRTRTPAQSTVNVLGVNVPCENVQAARDVICEEWTEGLMASSAGEFFSDMAISYIDRQRCFAWQRAAEQCFPEDPPAPAPAEVEQPSPETLQDTQSPAEAASGVSAGTSASPHQRLGNDREHRCDSCGPGHCTTNVGVPDDSQLRTLYYQAVAQSGFEHLGPTAEYFGKNLYQTLLEKETDAVQAVIRNEFDWHKVSGSIDECLDSVQSQFKDIRMRHRDLVLRDIRVSTPTSTRTAAFSHRPYADEFEQTFGNK